MMAANDRKTKNDNLPLFQLPVELRNRIYELVLVKNGSILIELPSMHNEVCRPPGILQACRQTRKEASRMYYSLNKFWTNDVVDSNQDGIQLSPPWGEATKTAVSWIGSLDRDSMLAVRVLRLNDQYYEESEIGDAARNLSQYYRELDEAGIELSGLILFVEFVDWDREDLEGDHKFWANSNEEAREKFGEMARMSTSTTGETDNR